MMNPLNEEGDLIDEETQDKWELSTQTFCLNSLNFACFFSWSFSPFFSNSFNFEAKRAGRFNSSLYL